MVICELHQLIDHYMIGQGTWPADRESLPAIFKTVRRLGLDEDVPDSPRTTRSTKLGEELQLDLMMAFVGAWDIWEIPQILESKGYLDESEADELCLAPLTEAEAERRLRWYVLRA
jgi:hypothetical protein